MPKYQVKDGAKFDGKRGPFTVELPSREGDEWVKLGRLVLLPDEKPETEDTRPTKTAITKPKRRGRPKKAD